MITAAEYRDWQKYSGTCFTHESPGAMLRLAGQELSPAGAVLLVVGQFVEENREGLDLFRWRNDVLALPQVAVQHVQRTARALAAIGASRIAAVLPAIEPAADSLFAALPTQLSDMKSIQEMMRAALKGAGTAGDPESRTGAMQDLASRLRQALHPPVPGEPRQHPPVESLAEVNELLERFAQAHQSELEGDIKRYGDPRKKPGFDPQRRLVEIEEEHRRRAQWAHQDQQADRFQIELKSLQEVPCEPASAVSKSVLRRATELFGNYQGWVRNRGRVSEKLSRWLDDFEQFRNSRPELFRRSPTNDVVLKSRLETIGEYQLEENLRVDGFGNDEPVWCLTWHAPGGFECDWTNLWLRFALPRNDASLTAILDTWDRFTRRAQVHLDRVLGELLEHFHIHHDGGPGPFLQSLYCDHAGKVVAEKVLKQVGGGRIEFEAFAADKRRDPPIVSVSAHFAVPWDDEHGFETGIEV